MKLELENKEIRFSRITFKEGSFIVSNTSALASLNNAYDANVEFNNKLIELACSKLEIKINNEWIKCEEVDIYFENPFISMDILTIFLKEIQPFLESCKSYQSIKQ